MSTPGVPLRAEASYVSTPHVIEREARALALDLRRHPHFWYPFVRGRMLRLPVYALVVLLVGVALQATWSVIVPAVVVFGAWTAVAARTWLATPYRVCLAVIDEGCPPGTVVSATYTASSFEFVLPGRTFPVDPLTVTAARRRLGCVLLDRAESVGPVCVPDELLGDDGMRVLRAALGDRFRED